MSSGATPGDIRPLVESLLQQAAMRKASDLHVEPVAEGYEIRYRLDGLLHRAQTLNAVAGKAVVSRLMVMAQLLTYRQDIPQEGQLQFPMSDSQGKTISVQGRVSIMPTRQGLRVAVRLPGDLGQPRALHELGFPQDTLAAMRQFAACDAGMLLVTGPAGAGKTTTLHALLGYIVEHQPGLSVVALEDPVERDLPGVTQIEVSPFGELTYERALRSMLRQDPQVLMLGEIRDAATASVAVQAALSGHRLLSTLHAATPGGAIARLLEMSVEPYQVTSAIGLIVSQRLLRRSAANGYEGRIAIAETAVIHGKLRQAVLDRADADALQAAAQNREGHRTLRDSAQALIDQGLTTPEELQRVLGQSSKS